MAKETTLAKKLASLETKRAKLRRELQLVRIRAAAKRRKASSKVYRAVGMLLQKEDAAAFDKLAAQSASKPRGRRRKRVAKAG